MAKIKVVDVGASCDKVHCMNNVESPWWRNHTYPMYRGRTILYLYANNPPKVKGKGYTTDDVSYISLAVVSKITPLLDAARGRSV